MPDNTSNAALIVAAGRGSRARNSANDAPKQYALIGGLPVLTHTLGVFLAHRNITLVQVVIHEDDKDLYDDAVANLAQHYNQAAAQARLLPPVFGGATRQASVRQGLDALQDHTPGTVLVHDAARPFAAASTITAVLDALSAHQGAIAAMPLTDTLKRAAADGTIAQTIDRAQLWRAQTPQGFRFTRLYKAHHAALNAGETSFTDDAAVAEWAGLDVALVEGNASNIKLTTAEDLIMADKTVQRGTAQSTATGSPEAQTVPVLDVRTGGGFDVHRFGPGSHVWLCGVKIPHDKTLEGHSDADVALHALTDALLGAIGDGDIGAHFPPSDPQWKGASSDRFLADAGKRTARLGATINNVDVTILCEEPKIGPHRDAMRASIARILQLDVARVSVKATTTERLGFTGRGEGIAAMASASVTMAPRS